MKPKATLTVPIWWPDMPRNFRSWLPSRGNVLFTTLMILLLVWAQTAGAFPALDTSATSTGTIAYQGRLADSSGNPLTTTVNMTFRLYSAATGGTPLWSEDWTGPNGVQVSDGLFNVMLGSLTPIPQSVIVGNVNLFLGITAGTDDEMSPRVQLGSVPFAVQALTVPDGSIGSEQIGEGSVTTSKLADASVTAAKIGGDVNLEPPDDSITNAKLELPYGFFSTLTTFTASQGSPQPIPDNKVSVTVDTSSKLLIILSGDMSGLTAVLSVAVDGTMLNPQVVHHNTGGRTTGAQSYVVDVAPGTHDIQMYLRSDSGTSSVYHRSLTVIAFD